MLIFSSELFVTSSARLKNVTIVSYSPLVIFATQNLFVIKIWDSPQNMVGVRFRMGGAHSFFLTINYNYK